MVPFFTGAILLLGIEDVLFRAIKLLTRDQYQALRLAKKFIKELVTNSGAAAPQDKLYLP